MGWRDQSKYFNESKPENAAVKQTSSGVPSQTQGVGTVRPQAQQTPATSHANDNFWQRAVNTVQGGMRDWWSGKVASVGQALNFGNWLNDKSSAADRSIIDSGYAGWVTDPLAEATFKEQAEKGNLRSAGVLKENKETARKVNTYADTVSEKGQKDISEAQEGLGFVGRTLVGAGSSAVEMGLDFASMYLLGAAGGGMNAAGSGGRAALNSARSGATALTRGTAGKATLASMATRVYGSAAQEARRNGADPAQAQAVGLMSAATEVFTESIFGGVGRVYGKGFADGIGNRVAMNLAKSPAGYRILKTIFSGVEEGGEEIISQLLEPFAKAVYAGHGEYMNRVGQAYKEQEAIDYVSSFATGALLGLVGEGRAELSRYGRANSNNTFNAMTELEKAGVNTREMTEEQIQKAYALQEAGTDVNGLKSEGRTRQWERIDEAYEALTPEQKSAVPGGQTANSAAQTQGLGSATALGDVSMREQLPSLVTNLARQAAQLAQVGDKAAADAAQADYEAANLVQNMLLGDIPGDQLDQVARAIAGNDNARALYEQIEGPLPPRIGEAIDMIVEKAQLESVELPFAEKPSVKQPSQQKPAEAPQSNADFGVTNNPAETAANATAQPQQFNSAQERTGNVASEPLNSEQPGATMETAPETKPETQKEEENANDEGTVRGDSGQARNVQLDRNDAGRRGGNPEQSRDAGAISRSGKVGNAERPGESSGGRGGIQGSLRSRDVSPQNVKYRLGKDGVELPEVELPNGRRGREVYSIAGYKAKPGVYVLTHLNETDAALVKLFDGTGKEVIFFVGELNDGLSGTLSRNGFVRGKTVGIKANSPRKAVLTAFHEKLHIKLDSGRRYFDHSKLLYSPIVSKIFREVKENGRKIKVGGASNVSNQLDEFNERIKMKYRFSDSILRADAGYDNPDVREWRDNYFAEETIVPAACGQNRLVTTNDITELRDAVRKALVDNGVVEQSFFDEMDKLYEEADVEIPIPQASWTEDESGKAGDDAWRDMYKFAPEDNRDEARSWLDSLDQTPERGERFADEQDQNGNVDYATGQNFTESVPTKTDKYLEGKVAEGDARFPQKFSGASKEDVFNLTPEQAKEARRKATEIMNNSAVISETIRQFERGEDEQVVSAVMSLADRDGFSIVDQNGDQTGITARKELQQHLASEVKLARFDKETKSLANRTKSKLRKINNAIFGQKNNDGVYVGGITTKIDEARARLEEYRESISAEGEVEAREESARDAIETFLMEDNPGFTDEELDSHANAEFMAFKLGKSQYQERIEKYIAEDGTDIRTGEKYELQRLENEVASLEDALTRRINEKIQVLQEARREVSRNARDLVREQIESEISRGLVPNQKAEADFLQTVIDAKMAQLSEAMEAFDRHDEAIDAMRDKYSRWLTNRVVQREIEFTKDGFVKAKPLNFDTRINNRGEVVDNNTVKSSFGGGLFWKRTDGSTSQEKAGKKLSKTREKAPAPGDNDAPPMWYGNRNMERANGIQGEANVAEQSSKRAEKPASKPARNIEHEIRQARESAIEGENKKPGIGFDYSKFSFKSESAEEQADRDKIGEILSLIDDDSLGMYVEAMKRKTGASQAQIIKELRNAVVSEYFGAHPSDLETIRAKYYRQIGYVYETVVSELNAEAKVRNKAKREKLLNGLRGVTNNNVETQKDSEAISDDSSDVPFYDIEDEAGGDETEDRRDTYGDSYGRVERASNGVVKAIGKGAKVAVPDPAQSFLDPEGSDTHKFGQLRYELNQFAQKWTAALGAEDKGASFRAFAGDFRDMLIDSEAMRYVFGNENGTVVKAAEKLRRASKGKAFQEAAADFAEVVNFELRMLPARMAYNAAFQKVASTAKGKIVKFLGGDKALSRMVSVYVGYQRDIVNLLEGLDGFDKYAGGPGYSMANMLLRNIYKAQNLKGRTLQMVYDAKMRYVKSGAQGQKIEIDYIRNKEKAHLSLTMDQAIDLEHTFQSLWASKLNPFSHTYYRLSDTESLLLSSEAQYTAIHSAIEKAINASPEALAYYKAFDTAYAQYAKPMQEAVMKANGRWVGVMAEGKYYPLSFRERKGGDPKAYDYDFGMNSLGFTQNRTSVEGGVIDIMDPSQRATSYIEQASKLIGRAEFGALLERLDRGGYAPSISEITESAYGKGQTDVIKQAIKDSSNYREDADASKSFLRQMRLNLQRGALLGNFGSMLKQYPSVFNASGVLDLDCIVRGIAAYTDVQNRNRAGEVGSIKTRKQGDIDPDLIDTLKLDNKINQLMNKLKIVDFYKHGFENVDTAAIKTIYLASEIQAAKDGKAGDAAYIEAKFREAFLQTQPQFDSMLRPYVQTTSNELVRMFGMFKTQPLRNLNTMIRAINEFRTAQKKYGTGSKEYNQSLKTLKNTIAGQTLASVMFGALGVVAKLLYHRRKDLEDENGSLNAEKVAARVLFNSIEASAGMLVLGDSAAQFLIDKLTKNTDVSTHDFYGISVGWLTTMKDTFDSFNDFIDKPTMYGFKKLAGNLATDFGIPLNNAYAIVNSLVMYAKDINGTNTMHYNDMLQLADKYQKMKPKELVAVTIDEALLQISRGNKDKAAALMQTLDANQAEDIEKYLVKTFASGNMTRTRLEEYLKTYAGLDGEKLEKALKTADIEAAYNTAVRADPGGVKAVKDLIDAVKTVEGGEPRAMQVAEIIMSSNLADRHKRTLMSKFVSDTYLKGFNALTAAGYFPKEAVDIIGSINSDDSATLSQEELFRHYLEHSDDRRAVEVIWNVLHPEDKITETYADTGIKNAFYEDRMTSDESIQWLVKNAGYTQEEAEKKVESWAGGKDFWLASQANEEGFEALAEEVSDIKRDMGRRGENSTFDVANAVLNSNLNATEKELALDHYMNDKFLGVFYGLRDVGYSDKDAVAAYKNVIGIADGLAGEKLNGSLTQKEMLAAYRQDKSLGDILEVIWNASGYKKTWDDVT